MTDSNSKPLRSFTRSLITIIHLVATIWTFFAFDLGPKLGGTSNDTGHAAFEILLFPLGHVGLAIAENESKVGLAIGYAVVVMNSYLWGIVLTAIVARVIGVVAKPKTKYPVERIDNEELD